MMQVSKKIPFDDPQVLMGVRGLYILSNLIIVGIYLYLHQKINSKKGTIALLVQDQIEISAELDIRRHDHPQIR